MKKILLLSFICAFIFSCTNEVKDAFNDSASVRVQKDMDAMWNFLTSSQHGWLMKYYPDGEQSYGGYNYLLKFEETGFVTVAFELAEEMGYDVSETIESHFSINASSSALLTFDTYNEFIHYFSDPEYGGGDTYGGEFEFTYVKGTNSEIELKGTKSHNKVILSALDSNFDWAEFMQEVVDLKLEITEEFFEALYLHEGTENEVPFVMDLDYNFIVYPDPSDPFAELEIPFVYTTEGIEFYEPVVIEGETIESLTYDRQAGAFVSKGGLTLTGRMSPDYVPYDFFAGNWIFPHGYAGPSTGGSGQSRPNAVVTMDQNRRYRTFTLNGLSMEGLDPIVQWSHITGNLTLLTQNLGYYQGSGPVYLCVWVNGGRLTNLSGAGFDLVWNGNETNPQLTCKENGVWEGYTADAFLFYDFNKEDAVEYYFSLNNLRRP